MLSLRLAFCVGGALTIFTACAPKPTEVSSQSNTVAPSQIDFSGRFGVGVRTAARTCVAIQNRSVPPDTPVTIIEPQAPQTFTGGRISAPSSEACPVSAALDPALTSYQISSTESSAVITKLVPFIVYVGSPSAAFEINNNNVEADLEGNHSRDTFRACSMTGGVSLSVWHNRPLIGTRLWAGHYDDNANAGTFPTCDAKEL